MPFNKECCQNNNQSVMKKKKGMILLLLFPVVVWSQQPRIPRVETYLSETGEPVTALRPTVNKNYCLPMQRYLPSEQLILDCPVFRNLGVRAIMPFGFSLNKFSEIQLLRTKNNLQESGCLPLRCDSVFSGISYMFCDSVVYGIRIQVNEGGRRAGKEQIVEELDKYFTAPDFSNKNRIVYSDEDFLVKYCLRENKIEVFSLFHYPIVESVAPGIKQKVYYGPQWYEFSEEDAVMLAFFNQETKENNVQLAAKLYFRGKQLAGLKELRFHLENGLVLSYQLQQEFTANEKGTKTERDTRIFMHYEQLKKMMQSRTVGVEIVGQFRTLSYQMPAFQKYSLHTAYEYFRWQATNPMIKYRGI